MAAQGQVQPTRLAATSGCCGARLCKNTSSRIAHRKSFSISSARKTKNTDDRHRRKTREKTMLRVLGSRAFSHGLGHLRSNLNTRRTTETWSLADIQTTGRREFIGTKLAPSRYVQFRAHQTVTIRCAFRIARSLIAARGDQYLRSGRLAHSSRLSLITSGRW
jgi:hypothetical protein